MKKILLIVIGCLLFAKGYSQYNYYRLSGGLNVGGNTAFADLKDKPMSQTIALSFDYNLTPFMSVGLEYQTGNLKGGNKETDAHRRYFSNNYTAFSVGGKLQLGQVVDFESNNILYAIRGLYSGIGVGIIKNKMKDVVRYQPPTYTYQFPGDDKSTNIIIPVNTGINFNLLDRWGYTRYIFNINYQLNVTIGEGLDGYNDASLNKGGSKAWSNIPDMYGVASVGIKVCFGPEGLY